MKIGLTYDLKDDYKGLGLSEEQIAEFDSPETINIIEKTISDLGYEVVRIGNVKNLIKLLAQGQRWDLVFNIAEGLNGLAREAQVPILLDIYEIPYTFSPPEVLINTLDKSIAKILVRQAGVPTPDFATIKQISDLKNLNLNFPLFAKPLAEGTGKGISANSHIKNKAELKTVCKDLLEKFKQPVLVETFLSGREFTVGIVGNGAECEVIGILEVILKENAEDYCHSYTNKENCEELVEYKISYDAEALKAGETAKKAWLALGGRDAGRLDLRSDDKGIPHFMEANPLAGIHPTHSDLPILATQAGIEYKELIRRIIDAAKKRNSIKDIQLKIQKSEFKG